jgi:RES domain-containing protein
MSTTASRSDSALRAYRIGSRRYELFDGGGAAASDLSRWNSRGRRVIYAAEHYATAVLETLARLNSVKLPASLVYIEIEIPSGVSVERVDLRRVKEWDAEDRRASQAFGDRWHEEQRTAVLIVPSLAAPGLEWNVAINQEHPETARVKVSALKPVVGHPRLLA